MSSDHSHHHHVHETAPLHDPVDAWHDHTHDEKPQHAHAEVGNAKLVIGVGVALFLIIALAAVGIEAFYRGYAAKIRSQMEQAAAASDSPNILARQERSEAYLKQMSTDPRWITLPGSGDIPTRQYAQLPLPLATDMTVREYSSVINAAPGARPEAVVPAAAATEFEPTTSAPEEPTESPE